MKRYNVILLVDEGGEKLLMCRRVKPPYQGLLNLVGGKAEPGEDGLHAAYRELREETGITAADTALRWLMTFTYPAAQPGGEGMVLEAYAGRLRHCVTLREEANPLCWIPLKEDFPDMTRYAGEGNIGHMVQTALLYHGEYLRVQELAVCLAPLTAEDLPAIAREKGCAPETLLPMLAQSQERRHAGRYYEQFTVWVNGCRVGWASLYAHADGTVSDGIEIMPSFRHCGVGTRALESLKQIAAARGYAEVTAQVRTDNPASLALHRRTGFKVDSTYVNGRGHEVYGLRAPLERRAPMRHEMSLRPGPFASMMSGKKRYELRLNDEKRSTIRVGDEIVFTRTSDEATMTVRVTSLHPFGSFAELYANLPLLSCGYTPENVADASPKDMEKYYPPEKQAQYGVLGIGIELVRLPVERLSGMYTVRLLTQADIPELLRVAQSNPLYYEYMGITPTEENLAASMQALPPRRTEPDKHFFGWFSGEKLVAAMDLITRHPKQDMAFIGWFILDADCQGKGLGRRLAGEVLAMLAEQGFSEVRLGRIKGNPQSEAFWHACGFTENGLSYDTDGYTVLIMSRDLP